MGGLSSVCERILRGTHRAFNAGAGTLRSRAPPVPSAARSKPSRPPGGRDGIIGLRMRQRASATERPPESNTAARVAIIEDDTTTSDQLKDRIQSARPALHARSGEVVSFDVLFHVVMSGRYCDILLNHISTNRVGFRDIDPAFEGI